MRRISGHYPALRLQGWLLACVWAGAAICGCADDSVAEDATTVEDVVPDDVATPDTVVAPDVTEEDLGAPDVPLPQRRGLRMRRQRRL
jgi:hypothetical protein